MGTGGMRTPPVGSLLQEARDDDDATNPTDASIDIATNLVMYIYNLCNFLFLGTLGGTKEGTRQGLRTAVHMSTAVLIP